MKNIVVVPFASRLHGEQYYMRVLDTIRSNIDKTGIRVEYSSVVTSEEEAKDLAGKYADYLPVFVALTGGTSKLMHSFALAANYNRVIVLAHGEHNSLPSAVSARSKLDMEGVWTWLFHCGEVESTECFLIVQQMISVAKAVASQLGSRVLLVGPYTEKPESAEDFESRFESRVDVLSLEEFESELERARRDYVEHFVSVFSETEPSIPAEKLAEIGKVYAVLRSLAETRGYEGIAMDCFPYLIKHRLTPCLALALLNSEGVVTACEGDLISLALMLISKALTGYTGWIANASRFEGTRAYFAHCTVALNMTRKFRITSHFESGYPYALAGELAPGVYTAVSMSPDFSVILAGTGRLLVSGLMYQTMCRTQLILDLDVNAEKIPLVAVSNHHVLIPGDVRKELHAIASLLGLDYAEYKELTGAV
ncbi:MAG: hypothetical protein QXK07_04605 [Desulfurococcaceae archaeon]